LLVDLLGRFRGTDWFGLIRARREGNCREQRDQNEQVAMHGKTPRVINNNGANGK
jgi:hypothetical protein